MASCFNASTLILLLLGIVTIQRTDADPNDIDLTPPELEMYTRFTEWISFETQGPLSAKAADFVKDGTCLRAIVFLADGIPLIQKQDNLITLCDGASPTTGLFNVNGNIHYYDVYVAMIENAEKKQFTLIYKKGTLFEENWAFYSEVHISNNRAVMLPKTSGGKLDKPSPLQIDTSKTLLSASRDTGTFQPADGWASINPWNPLGALFKTYTPNSNSRSPRYAEPDKSFRLLALTSYSYVLDVVKIHDSKTATLFITDQALYYGSAIKVTTTDLVTFTILLQDPEGFCVKKIVSKSNTKEGAVKIDTTTTEKLERSDENCQNLIEGKITEANVNNDYLTAFQKDLSEEIISVVPYTGEKFYEMPEEKLKYNELIAYNPISGMGIAVKKVSKSSTSVEPKLVVVYGGGIPLGGLLMENYISKRVVIRENVVYHSSYIMLMRLDLKSYVMLTKKSKNSCLKKTIALKEENGKTVARHSTVDTVKANVDDDCMKLLLGKNLKSSKSKDSNSFGSATDFSGVPSELV